ncbi:MAG: RNA polymerase sigma-70 factor [Muribaculaceae bacterium]
MQNDLKQLLNSIAAGDEQAYKTLFYMYYPRVRAFALGMLKNIDDADDLAQMVMMKVWLKRELFSGVDNFDSYMFRLTKNSVLNFIASRQAVFAELSDDVADNRATAASYNPEAQLEAHDAGVMIDVVVGKMPPQRQAVYRLSRVQQLSNDEIAAKLGITRKTVENHLNLALNDIRKALKMLIFLIITNSSWG